MDEVYRDNGLGEADVESKIELLDRLMPWSREQRVTYPTIGLKELERYAGKKIPAMACFGGRIIIVGPEETLDSVDPGKALLKSLEINFGIVRGAYMDALKED